MNLSVGQPAIPSASWNRNGANACRCSASTDVATNGSAISGFRLTTPPMRQANAATCGWLFLNAASRTCVTSCGVSAPSEWSVASA